MVYVIEYKACRYPYNYWFLRKDGDYITFDSLIKARKKCISLIKDYTAILAVVRGGVEQLVYQTVKGNFVLEDRTKNKWYRLNKDGSLGSVISNIRDLGLIRSA